MLFAFCHKFIKEEVDATRDQSCIILVLFHTSKKCGLLFASVVKLAANSNNVAPIAAKHGIRFAASGLSIGQY